MIRFVDVAVLLALTVSHAAFAQGNEGQPGERGAGVVKKKQGTAQPHGYASKSPPSWIYLSSEFSPPDDVVLGSSQPSKAMRSLKQTPARHGSTSANTLASN